MEQYIAEASDVVAIVIGAVLIARVIRDIITRVAETWRDASNKRADADTKIVEALEKLGSMTQAGTAHAEDAKLLIGSARRDHQTIIAELSDSDYGLHALLQQIKAVRTKLDRCLTAPLQIKPENEAQKTKEE